MTVLVTGGAGFIGSHLVDACAQRGMQVRVLDNFATGYRQNLSHLSDEIELCEGDLRNPEDCAVACKGVELVYHLGALGSVPRSVADPITTNAVNTTGTLNLLHAARHAGVHRFVYSSSSSVYGDSTTLPKMEAMRPAPRSPYAVSKLAAEEYCRAFFLTYGLETVALRYFNVFGPRQSLDAQYAAVIPRFIAAFLSGQQPVIYGDGLHSRDFTFVTNVVEANLLAGAKPGIAGQVFNIACGEQITLKQVLERIAALLSQEPAATYLPARTGDIRHSLADITAARQALGYQPQVPFAEGLQRTVEAYVRTFCV